MDFNRSDVIGNRAEQTGKAGVGTVFVSAVEPVVRIRAGEKGEKGTKTPLERRIRGVT